MSQETTTTTEQGQQMQVRIDDRDVQWGYANWFNVGMTQEVLLEFGYFIQTAAPTGTQAQAQGMLRVGNRVLMNYVTAKRLMNSLQQSIKRYEQQFGEIPTQQPAQR